MDSNAGTLTLNCTIPTNPDPNSTNAGGPTMDGEYDSWVQIEDYGLNYVSQYTESTNEVASFVYAGLQTKRRDGTTSIYSTMQKVNNRVCANTTKYSDDSTATFSLRDNRDSKDYLIRRLEDGNCWMIQNLRFVGTTITPDNTNINVTKTLSYNDFTTTGSYTDVQISSGNDYDGNPAVWYNYAAASAMTVTGSSNSSEAQYDICPKGWRLPSRSQAPLTGAQFLSGFNQVTGGRHYGADLSKRSDASYGWWWTRTVYTSDRRYYFRYCPNGTGNSSSDYDPRTYGVFVRCVIET